MTQAGQLQVRKKIEEMPEHGDGMMGTPAEKEVTSESRHSALPEALKLRLRECSGHPEDATKIENPIEYLKNCHKQQLDQSMEHLDLRVKMLSLLPGPRHQIEKQEWDEAMKTMAYIKDLEDFLRMATESLE